jgi:hypothetical protein
MWLILTPHLDMFLWKHVFFLFFLHKCEYRDPNHLRMHILLMKIILLYENR